MEQPRKPLSVDAINEPWRIGRTSDDVAIHTAGGANVTFLAGVLGDDLTLALHIIHVHNAALASAHACHEFAFEV